MFEVWRSKERLGGVLPVQCGEPQQGHSHPETMSMFKMHKRVCREPRGLYSLWGGRGLPIVYIQWYNYIIVYNSDITITVGTVLVLCNSSVIQSKSYVCLYKDKHFKLWFEIIREVITLKRVFKIVILSDFEIEVTVIEEIYNATNLWRQIIDCLGVPWLDFINLWPGLQSLPFLQ